MLDREDTSIEPYDQVQRRALALLRREREQRSLQALVETLRKKYAAQIKIDEPRLREAIPDSMLQR